jgi:hypothetical protein
MLVVELPPVNAVLAAYVCLVPGHARVPAIVDDAATELDAAVVALGCEFDVHHQPEVTELLLGDQKFVAGQLAVKGTDDLALLHPPEMRSALPAFERFSIEQNGRFARRGREGQPQPDRKCAPERPHVILRRDNILSPVRCESN